MRPVLISGVILAIVGVFLLVKGFSYTRQETVFKVGGIEAKATQKERVPEWVGGLALGAGAVLIGFGLKKR